MTELHDAIRMEIEDLHRFFVDWFTGVAAGETLNDRFGAAMAPDVVFISPDGQRLTRDDLMTGIGAAHGGNPNIRIAVRDVRVLREIGDSVLVTYEEWQIGAARPGHANNGRLSTALITRDAPHQWRHIHETWLPEDVQAAGPYDF